MAEVRAVFRKLVLGLFLMLTALPVLLKTIGNPAHKSYLLALLAAAFICGLFFFLAGHFSPLRKRINGLSPTRVCVLMSAVCLLLNGGFAFFFRPVQAADYRTFFQVARDLSEGMHPGMKDYVAMFPHILGYSAFLSVFLRVFGEHLAVAVVLNVLLTVASGIMLFAATRTLTDTFSAAAVYVLWILCPSKLFYNTMSLSEPYYTCLLAAFFLMAVCVSKRLTQQGRRIYGLLLTAAVLSGLLLALIQSARPIAAVPLLALGLWVLLLQERADLLKNWRQWGAFFLLMLLCYAAGKAGWTAYAAAQLEQTPPSVPGYNIYVGFNQETGGSYCNADMDLLQGRYFGECERNAVAAQQMMLEDAKTRIRAVGGSLPALMLAKLQTLMGHDEGGAYYAMESLSPRQYSLSCMVSNVWYYALCILSAAGALALWKRRESGPVLAVVLFVIGLILAQLLVEVAARYHYALIPMMLLVGAFALDSHRDAVPSGEV